MKLDKILVGIDFSPESVHALAHAERVAARFGAKLLVAHAAQSTESSDQALALGGDTLGHFRSMLVQAKLEGQRRLEGIIEELAGRGVVAEERVIEGYADSAMVDAAEADDVDLVVVGTYGKKGISRLLLGSVAERVVRHCERHVLVVRGPSAGYRRVLAAVDFSELSPAVLAAAAGLVEDGGRVELFFAWQLAGLSGGLLPSALSDAALKPVRASVEQGARDKADALLGALDTQAELSVTIEEASPARAIAERAEQGHDLIVMGGHGHRGLRRLILGSVAEATVRQANCSVWVVH